MTSIANEFERIHVEFAEALIVCRAKPAAKAVHRLRRLTRITEALLRKAAEDHPGAGELHKRAKKAAKKLKRIRRSAGHVRNLDVLRKIAKDILGHALKPATVKMRPLLLGEYESLDAKLSHRRDRAQKELTSLLATHEVSMELALEKAGAAIKSLRSK